MSFVMPNGLTVDQRIVYKKVYNSFQLKNNFNTQRLLDKLFANDLTNIISSYMSNTKLADRFAILGGAGMGKTYLVCKLISSLDVSSRICVITPTHKAKSVIIKTLENNNCKIFDIDF